MQHSDEIPMSAGPDWLQGDGDALYWLAGSRLMRHQAGTRPVDVTPPGVRIGNGVHAYGGRPYLVTPDAVWCATPDGLFRDSTLVAEGAYGDLVLGDGELLAVREDATGDALVAVPLDGGPLRVLAEAAGFFGSPRPAGGMLAWTWWSAKDMPWDACEVWVAGYEPGGDIGDPMRVAGGGDEAAIEPRWGPDGMLYFMSDRTGWWNLFRHDGTAVAPMSADCAAPPWELGNASYCFLDDGRIAMLVREGPSHRLVLSDGSAVPLPYNMIKPCLTAWGSSVALAGSAPGVGQQLAIVDPASSSRRVVASVAVPAPGRVPVPVDGDRLLVALVYGAAGGPAVVRVPAGPPDLEQVRRFNEHGFTVVDIEDFADAADCRTVASHLIDSGLATPVFIHGEGIGGPTALRAAGGPFTAAAASPPAPAPRFLRPLVRRMGAPVDVKAVPIPVHVIDGTGDDAELGLYRRAAERR
ncbi:S9 family peptidase [Dactylosporangium sp. NPDC000521]|uniref:S9 family peptidase n=1 Tax=Dactylosporangium sp. NPDC000521 TaxID=3363975 RepID=UPI0036B8F78B